MLKRDWIFYTACCLSAVGLILAALGNEPALLLFVAAYLLRPALHEFGVTRQSADERQLVIHSRSGNIAFVAVILAAVGTALWRVANGQLADDLYPLIFIGLGVRALTGLVMNGEYLRAGAIIIGAIGAFTGLFVLLETGLTTGGMLGLLLAAFIMALAWIATVFPRTMSLVLVAIALILIVGFDLYQFRRVQTALWLFVVAPVLVAAACPHLGGGKDADAVTPRKRLLIFGSLGAGAAVVFALLVVIGGRDSDGSTANRIPKGEVVETQGIPATGIIERYSDGTLKLCTLAREDTISGQPLASGTVVAFEPDSTMKWCFLQQPTEIQGHLCKGSGHNFMTGFYPSGQLRLAWLDRDEVIDGIPCAAFRFMSNIFGGGDGTHFHANGRLAETTLSKDFEIDGQLFKKGTVVRFDSLGNLTEHN